MDAKNKFAHLSLLVVHDTPPLRNLLVKMVQSFGFTKIVAATNGQEGLLALKKAASKEDPIRIVISDWHMPNMTGLELLQAMREMEVYKHTPFLVVTSGISKEETVDTIKSGVTDFIMNPIRADRLLEKLVKCIKRIKKDEDG